MKNEKLTMMTFFPFTYKLSEPLAKYTALQAGGAADYFLEPSSPEEYAELLKYLQKNEFPFVILREAPIPA